MIGICHKCKKTEIEIENTAVLLSEIGTVSIPLCEKCRKN